MSEEQTSAEEQARSNGWLPQEEYQGDPENWVGATEFNKRGELLGTIIKEQRKNKKMAREITELKDSMRELGEHNKKIAKIEREKAKRDLLEIKERALEEGDSKTVVDIDDQLLDIKVQEKEADEAADTPPAQPAAPEELIEWAEDNPTIANNPLLSKVFEAQLASLVSENPSLRNDPAEALRQATELIEEEFPEKFETQGTRKTRQAVMGKTGKSGDNSTVSGKSLSAEQRTTVRKMIDSGAPITEDEYAQQLADIGEL